MYQRIKYATTFLFLSSLLSAGISYGATTHIVKPLKKVIRKTQTEPRKKAKPQDLNWLAMNIYHEARGGSLEGMYAVGIVTMNRVNDESYPKSVKAVITQPHQFSWFKGNISEKAKDVQSYEIARNVAQNVLEENMRDKTYVKVKKRLGEAVYFHANYVRPSWARKKRFIAKIDKHLFYI